MAEHLIGNIKPDINEQTPNYDEATKLETLTSGEKISVAFGKIKKAITDFIAHKSDTTGHITSTERTVWNGKAPGGHGLGDKTFGSSITSYYDFLKMGCGFYQSSYEDGSPRGINEWLGLLQLSRGESSGGETGTQVAFRDISPQTPQMWLRAIYNGTEGNWVEMLHTGNIDDYRHKIVTSAYTGDSTQSRKISLEFTPDIVIVFGKSGISSFLTSQNGYRGCGGMAFKGYPCGVGENNTIEIVEGGFNVSYIAPQGDATANVPMTNEQGAVYYYMAIRQPLF